MISEFYYTKRQYFKMTTHIQNRENYTKKKHDLSTIYIQKTADVEYVIQTVCDAHIHVCVCMCTQGICVCMNVEARG